MSGVDPVRVPSGQALVNDAPTGHRRSGFDPSRERFAGVGLTKRKKSGAELKATNRLRAVLVERQGNRCHYCRRRMTVVSGHPMRRTDATLEHVVRRSEGGALSLDNCVAACYACNAHQDYLSRGKAFLRWRLVAAGRRIQGWLTRDSDGSAEGDETRSGSTVGDSADPKGIAQGDPA